METFLKVITPEDAQDLLKSNSANRGVNRSNLQYFKNQLKSGSFFCTHQGIAISADGKLLDGQHRLLAIAQTGIEAQMMVTIGLDPDTFVVMDAGSKRSAGDALSIEGASNATKLAAAIRLWIGHQNAPNLQWEGSWYRNHASATFVLSEYLLHKQEWNYASTVGGRFAAPTIVPPSVIVFMAGAATIQGKSTAEEIEQFFSLLRHGNDLRAGDPILAYRNYTLSNPIKKMPQQAILANCIKVFNYWRAGTQLSMFKPQACPCVKNIKGETIPMIGIE